MAVGGERSLGGLVGMKGRFRVRIGGGKERSREEVGRDKGKVKGGISIPFNSVHFLSIRFN